jgi:MFS family permease
VGSADDAVARPPRTGASLRYLLALERNPLAVVSAMFLMALGENLWRRFLPKYLEALGAPVVAIGAYGSLEDALDGLYQYPGGWASDRYGRRRALLLFVSLAAVGYLIIAAAPAWPVVLVGLLFIMCWTSMASPTLFAVVGDALPSGRRSVGFSVQAILRRLPILVAPGLGGTLIAAVGVRAGVQGGLLASVVLAVVTLLVVRGSTGQPSPSQPTSGSSGARSPAHCGASCSPTSASAPATRWWMSFWCCTP